MSDTDIPQRYIDFCKAVGRLAREHKLRNLTMQFNPGFDDIWREQIEMSWASGRHYADAGKVSITSTRRLNTTVDTIGSSNED